MEGLDCPMQTKALNLFWHKAELRLVTQPQPEAPVFAISRPTFFGGREEFLLQYPARLEPPSKRDLARHRFTVRHGKKRKSFQAPDAATFDKWLSALELALEPKRDSDPVSTPSSTATTATATSSQGRMSVAGSTGTWTRSRVSTLGGAASRAGSLLSNASSVAMPPPSRITLERECFKRDPKNHKLIRLHRPARVVAGSEVHEAKSEELASVQTHAEEDYVNIFAPEDTPTKVFAEREPLAEDDQDDSLSFTDKSKSVETATTDFVVESVNEPTANGSIHIELEDVESEVKAAIEALIVAVSEGECATNKDEKIDIEPEVQVIVEELVAQLVEAENDEFVTEGISSGACVNESVVDAEVAAAVAALVVAVIKKNGDRENVFAGNALDTGSATAHNNNIVVSGVNCRGGFKTESAVGVSTRSASVLPMRKWVPLDPTSSSLIWVRGSIDADVKSAPPNNSRRRSIKPARKWVPVDPSTTRLVWIRRVESAAARMQPRYKATSNSKRWVPLESDNSRFIWVRRQNSPVSSVAA